MEPLSAKSEIALYSTNWSLAMTDAPTDATRVSQCTIVLVHGTWGRSFFPKRRQASLYPPNKRRWFEEGSQFQTRLDKALKGASLDWPVRPFLWSGANSVHARDCAARKLSAQLKDLLGDPNAAAVIIAHSHGGNVALRALQHLGSTAGRIRVVTLATPFLRVFARESLRLPFVIKVLMCIAINFILVLIASFIVRNLHLSIPAGVEHYLETGLLFVPVSLPVAIFIVWWLIAIFVNPHAALTVAQEAHYDTKRAGASRMLVIRGVDDEASLALAAGSIGSRLSYLILRGVVPMIFLAGGVVPYLAVFLAPVIAKSVFVLLMIVFSFVSTFGALIFLFLPGVFKSFFGREFLFNAMLCEIAVDSVPDTLGQVEAITLSPIETTSFRQLRHGIYSHPTCVDEIVRWLRRVTCMPSPRADA